MRIQVNDDKEFDRLLESLSFDVVHANIHYKLFRDLYGAKVEFEREMRQSWTFWWLTIEAHRDYALYLLARVFDQEQKSLGLRNFLQTIQKYVHLFDEVRFRERLRGNKFVDSLAKSARRPDLVKLQEHIALVTSSDKNADPAVRRLVTLRNTELAHRAPKPLLRPRTPEESQRITWTEIEHLLKLAVKLLNRYSSLFKATSYSTQIVGHDDYRHVLLAVRENLRKWEQDIAEEIERSHQLSKDRRVEPTDVVRNGD